MVMEGRGGVGLESERWETEGRNCRCIVHRKCWRPRINALSSLRILSVVLLLGLEILGTNAAEGSNGWGIFKSIERAKGGNLVDTADKADEPACRSELAVIEVARSSCSPPHLPCPRPQVFPHANLFPPAEKGRLEEEVHTLRGQLTSAQALRSEAERALADLQQRAAALQRERAAVERELEEKDRRLKQEVGGAR
eukprot:3940731-Rhodomonas_salina.1